MASVLELSVAMPYNQGSCSAAKGSCSYQYPKGSLVMISLQEIAMTLKS